MKILFEDNSVEEYYAESSVTDPIGFETAEEFVHPEEVLEPSKKPELLSLKGLGKLSDAAAAYARSFYNAQKAEVEQVQQTNEKITDERIKSFAEEDVMLGDEQTERASIVMKPIEMLKQDGGAPQWQVIVLGVVLLGLAVTAFFLFREYSLRRQTAAQLVQSEQLREKMEAGFEQLKKEMGLQKQELAQVSQDLDQAKAKAEAEAKRIRAYEEQIEELRKTYEGQINDFKNQLKMKTDLTNVLRSNLESLRHSMEQNSEVSGADSQSASTEAETPISGTVTMVDKRNHFIVINVGHRDRISAGQRIRLFSDRGNEFGEARIDRIYHELSAATILSDQTMSRVQKGDRFTVAA